MTSPGPHAAAVDALLERLAAVPWLLPDAEMNSLEPAAVQWLEERADEHRAAVNALWTGAPLALAHEVTRDARAAHGRAGHVAAVDALPEFAPAAVAWAGVLEHARRGAWHAARRALGDEPAAALADRAWKILRRAPGVFADELPDEARDAFDAAWRGHDRHLYATGVPGGEAAVLLALWTATHGPVSAAATPWAPLLALWERGACTLASTDGALLLYVPVREGAPQREAPVLDWPTPETWAARNDAARPFAPGLLGSGGWDTGTRGPREGDQGEASLELLRRFNRAGLGPLPGMYPLVQVAWRGIVNYPPPPPEFFVVRPPPRPLTPERFAAACDALPDPYPRDADAPSALPELGPWPPRPPPWARRRDGAK